MPLHNSWKNLLKFIPLFFITVGLFQYAGILIMGLGINYLAIATPLQTLIINLFSLAGSFLLVWVFRKYADKESFISLGFQKIKVIAPFMGLLIGFIIMLTGFIVLLLLGQLKVVSYNINWANLLISTVLFISVAFTEELIVRGYMLNNLMKAVNRYYALIISAIIFALLHLGNPHISLLSLFNLFLAGILLGLTYIYTKNLWFPIALHFSWNFFQGPVFGFNVSGNNFYSVIIQKVPYNSVWNGGSFGFEGSIPCILLQLITIGVLFRVFESANEEKLSRFLSA